MLYAIVVLDEHANTGNWLIGLFSDRETAEKWAAKLPLANYDWYIDEITSPIEFIELINERTIQ